MTTAPAAPAATSSRIIHVIGPVHMGRQHRGLHEEALSHKVELTKLKKCELVILLNYDGSRYKAYTSENAFIDHDPGYPMMEEALKTGKINIGLKEPLYLPKEAINSINAYIERMQKERQLKRKLKSMDIIPLKNKNNLKPKQKRYA